MMNWVGNCKILNLLPKNELQRERKMIPQFNTSTLCNCPEKASAPLFFEHSNRKKYIFDNIPTPQN
jgi:hypothetical protein